MHPWLTDGGRVPHRHWILRDNRLEYLRWLELQLDFVKPEDWYGVTHSDFINNKGDSIYRHVYNNNRMMIVSEIWALGLTSYDAIRATRCLISRTNYEG